MSERITASIIEEAMSYQAYRDLVDRLLAEKKVTGDFMDNNDDILHYTKMNVTRMKRGDKTFALNDDLRAALEKISEPTIWLVITEGWCGDAGQIIPSFVKMAEANPHITVKFILRDEHPAIMDGYLTNGGRSIPKLIALKASDLSEYGNWGPRPAPAQEMTMAYKKNDDLDYKTYANQLHSWYAKDKYQTIQAELTEQIKKWYSLD